MKGITFNKCLFINNGTFFQLLGFLLFTKSLFLMVVFFLLSGPLSSIQVGSGQTNPSSAAFNMNELVDQFKTMASQAGFDNTYIDSAVKDICSAKKAGADPVKDYNKILQSVTELTQEHTKE